VCGWVCGWAVICALPGSRGTEVARHMPIFGQVIERVYQTQHFGGTGTVQGDGCGRKLGYLGGLHHQIRV